MGQLKGNRVGKTSLRTRIGAMAGAVVLLAPGLAGATAAVDLYYERAFMLAADARCGLFSPQIASALAAATVQARGAALRAGVGEDGLADVARRASSRAAGAACNSPDLTLAAGRVRSAFEGFARLTQIEYPGEIAGWRGVRAQPVAGFAAWGLSQTSQVSWGDMTFGVAVRGAGRPLMSVARFSDGLRPYAARLVLRDAGLAPRPYLDRSRASGGAPLPLASRIPPRTATRVFTAEARSPVGQDLAGESGRAGWAFRFPAAADTALTGLDPRESVAVEFVFTGPQGDYVRTAYVEVGDYAAGRAFLNLR